MVLLPGFFPGEKYEHEYEMNDALEAILNKMADHSTSSGNAPRRETLLLFMLAVIVVLIYAETLTTPFIFDDIHNIRENPHIRIPFPSFKNLAWAGFHSPIATRPVANISFALNYYFNGYNPVGYHLVNILVHLASGCFLFYLVKLTLHTPALHARYAEYGWIPFFTAFIWLVHPLQTQSVTYLVQRMNSMAAMFYVLSLLLYLKFRMSDGGRSKWLYLGGCILVAVLALGTKEISATLPGFIILYEWFFFQRLSLQWAQKRLLIFVGLLALIALISTIYLEYELSARISDSYNGRHFTMMERVLTQFRVVVFYISLLIWPHPARLSLDHDFALSYSLTNPMTTLPAMALIIGLIILAIVFAGREPLLSFCILWFFGNLVIESSVIGLELIFEHRNYLPSMMAVLGAVVLVFRFLKPAWKGATALFLVAILFTFWTFQRNKDWVDEITLYQDCVKKAPAKARPYNNLGAALMRANRLTEAVEQLQKALEIKPDFVDAHYNLGYALSRQGKLAEGIDHFRETLRLDPDNFKALNNMGVSLAIQGRYQEAIQYLESALKLSPGDVDVHSNIGIAFYRLGNLAAAEGHLTRALSLNPRHAGAHNNFGLVMKDKGRLEAAHHHFSRALELNPNHVEARRNLEDISQQKAERHEVGSGNAEVGN
jgi:tetratricopeptide (TPR) repeat protein